MSSGFQQNSLKRDWFILTSLVSKDFKRRYRRSVLGVLWSVLNPLLMMVVLTVVFSTFFRFSIEYYPVYLILGQVLFNLMNEATNQSLRSIIDSAPLIKKIRINKWLFPLEKTTFALVNFVFSFIACIVVMMYFRIMPTIHVLWLPFVVICVYLFSLGLSFMVSALVVFFRDVEHLWTVLLTAWTYATPLFYPVDILPDWAVPIMRANPMYHYVTVFRKIMLYGQAPSTGEIIVCIFCALFFLGLGFLIFNKMQKKFILYV